MKTWIKTLVILAAIGMVTATMLFVFVINKSHPDYETKKADYSLSAIDIFNDYSEDIQNASKKYNGKIIEIESTLTEIESSDGQIIACFVLKEGVFGPEGVRIRMLENQKNILKDIAIGEKVTLKGYVTGYNETDVILEHGSIVVQ
ncbi:MAG: hypothetical protein CVT92_15915 [Bacteroidetes bacterium HGW-Bacteroidetes-1]|jgi:hypothetical protein|nr:MAG: hypothetical protein CVT92_15915 [Bacteroidetes bacterium HGW-Bacteroidetes-1]